jgi:tetratricopeptide (TPR) repeat protein
MSRKPANRLAAALLAAAWCVTAAPAALALGDPAAEHDQCVAEAEKDPEAALIRARQWSRQGGGPDADHCAAMALYDLRRYPEAAQAFDGAARATAAASPILAAQIFDQAGQAWLVANEPQSARTEFDAAIRLSPDDPDLRIDRAEALAALGQYWKAVDDLNRASDLAPKRAEIYAYRAAAYRALNELTMARADIARNLRLAPDNPVGLLERGNIRRLDGDLVGARRDWLEVTRIARGTPEAAAAAQNLDRLGAIREGGKPARGAGKGPS